MNYDAIIVGSGQGGNPLAFRLADLGWSVALIEKKDLGGTCINVGCTPTKTMVHRAQVAHYARNAARWGVNASNVSVDLARIVAQKDEVVLSFRGGRQKQVDRRANLRLHRGHARFVGAHQLKVGDDLLESEKIFIDTGGRPSIPAIPGLETVSYLTNESVMQLTALPGCRKRSKPKECNSCSTPAPRASKTRTAPSTYRSKAPRAPRASPARIS